MIDFDFDEGQAVDQSWVNQSYKFVHECEIGRVTRERKTTAFKSRQLRICGSTGYIFGRNSPSGSVY